MKTFWPHRPKANGFLIENLDHKFRLNISSASTNQISNKLSDNKNSTSLINDTNNDNVDDLLIKRQHWANRDFSEYLEAA